MGSARREESSTGLTMVFTWFVPRWRRTQASHVGANGWITQEVLRVVLAAAQKECYNKFCCALVRMTFGLKKDVIFIFSLRCVILESYCMNYVSDTWHIGLIVACRKIK